MNGHLLDTNVPSELTRTVVNRHVEQWLKNTSDELLYFSATQSGLLGNQRHSTDVDSNNRHIYRKDQNCDNIAGRRPYAMKTTPNDADVVHMPPDLLAEARRAATEEHRAANELVSDAVRRYLDSRRTECRNECVEDKPHKNLARLLIDPNSPGAFGRKWSGGITAARRS